MVPEEGEEVFLLRRQTGETQVPQVREWAHMCEVVNVSTPHRTLQYVQLRVLLREEISRNFQLFQDRTLLQHFCESSVYLLIRDLSRHLVSFLSSVVIARDSLRLILVKQPV